MSEEKLMRKYGYGYKHSKDLLNEPYVKDLQQRIDKAIEYIKENACFDGKQCKCSFSTLALDKLLNILGSDSND